VNGALDAESVVEGRASAVAFGTGARRAAELTVVGLGFLVATLWFLRPVAQLLATHIVPESGDTLFNLYVLEWGKHQIGLGMPDFWNANLFYPVRGALALSDHLLALAAEDFVLSAFLPTPAAAYNVLLVLAFAASGTVTYAVARASGCGRAASTVAGAVFAFSPFRWHNLNHLQILSVEWAPLVLWLWHRLLLAPSARRAGAFLAAYLVHLAGGCYPAYMIHAALAALLIVHVLDSPGRFRRLETWRPLVPVLALAAVAGAALFLPYVRTSREVGFERAEDEVETFGATLTSYASPAQGAGFLPFVPRERPQHAAVPTLFTRVENRLFPGACATLLAAVGCAAWIGREQIRGHTARRARRFTLGLVGFTLTVTALAVSDLRTFAASGVSLAIDPEPLPRGVLLTVAVAGLGLLAVAAWPRRRGVGDGRLLWWRGVLLWGALTVLLSFPLLYVPLMRVVPGLSGMRVPARFYVFTSLALALLAAAGVDALLAKLARPVVRAAVATFVLGLILWELAPRPFRFAPLPAPSELSPVYAWLARAPDVHAILELPVRPNTHETEYLYASTVHWKPLANGYSGFHPPVFARLVGTIPDLPDAAGFALLRELGISHLVVHFDDRRLAQTAATFPAWRRDHLGRDAEEAFRDGDDVVYRVLPAPRRPA
jgi:hypothetical protein